MEIKITYDNPTGGIDLRLFDSFINEVKKITKTGLMPNNSLNIRYGKKDVTVTNFDDLYDEYNDNDCKTPDNLDFHIYFTDEAGDRDIALYVFNAYGNKLGLSITHSNKNEALLVQETFKKIFRLDAEPVVLQKEEKTEKSKGPVLAPKESSWFTMSNFWVAILAGIVILGLWQFINLFI